MESPGKQGNLPVVGAVAVTIVCWGSNFPTIRYVLQAYDPLAMSALRVYIGALVLAGVAGALRMPLPAWRDWPLLALFGATGIAAATLTLNFGLHRISAGAGVLIIGTVPVMSALLARGFLAERLGGQAWAGIAVSFAGVGLIALGEGEGFRVNTGALFVLASAANQAFFYVFQKWLHGRYTPFQITCGSIWSAAVLLLPLAPHALASAVAAPWGQSLGVLYLGLFPTAIAFAAWNFALSRARAALVTSSMYAMPLLAISLAYLWLGEVPTLLTLTGGLAALGGVALLHMGRR